MCIRDSYHITLGIFTFWNFAPCHLAPHLNGHCSSLRWEIVLLSRIVLASVAFKKIQNGNPSESRIIDIGVDWKKEDRGRTGPPSLCMRVCIKMKSNPHKNVLLSHSGNCGMHLLYSTPWCAPTFPPLKASEVPKLLVQASNVRENQGLSSCSNCLRTPPSPKKRPPMVPHSFLARLQCSYIPTARISSYGRKRPFWRTKSQKLEKCLKNKS